MDIDCPELKSFLIGSLQPLDMRAVATLNGGKVAGRENVGYAGSSYFWNGEKLPAKKKSAALGFKLMLDLNWRKTCLSNMYHILSIPSRYLYFDIIKSWKSHWWVSNILMSWKVSLLVSKTMWLRLGNDGRMAHVTALHRSWGCSVQSPAVQSHADPSCFQCSTLPTQTLAAPPCRSTLQAPRCRFHTAGSPL